MLELRALVRVTHILAGAAWVGGSLFYLVIVIPALHSVGASSTLAAKIAETFKRMVNVCVGVLLLTGGYLVFDRLTQTTLGLSYLIVLAIKIVAAIGMFILAAYLAQSNIRRLAKRSTRFSKAAPQLMLAIGILVFILGAILNSIFEMSIAPH